MDAVAFCPRLSSLNRLDNYQSIAAGGLTVLDIHGTELLVAIRRYIPLSASTLTSLIARCVNATFVETN